jgi:hypothetical protein
VPLGGSPLRRPATRSEREDPQPCLQGAEPSPTDRTSGTAKKTPACTHTKFDGLRSTIDARFDSLRSTMDSRFDAVDTRFDGIDRRIDGLDRDVHMLVHRALGGDAA